MKKIDDKIYKRAESFARKHCGLSKVDDFIFFDCCVDAYLAGYNSAKREEKK